MKYYYLILFGLFACVFNYVRAQEHRLLRDPYAYETAAEMYAVADTLPFDDTAALLVADVSRQLIQVLMPENDVIWDALQKLEPYRTSGQVQEALKTWAEYVRKNDKSGSGAIVSSDRHLIFPVVQAYRQGEFDEVIALSRQLLLSPELRIGGQLLQVVRCNLALALMHENRDLCAQLELEVINEVVFPYTIRVPRCSQEETEPLVHAPVEIKIRYFPALINLTLVYERLGKREDAELVANRLKEYMKKEKLEVPLADFNAAWYLGEKEDYHSTDKALKMVSSYSMKKQGASKYADYKKQLIAKYKSSSILRIGFLGKAYTGSGSGWIVGILGFIIYWIAVAIGPGKVILAYFIELTDFSPFRMTLLMLFYFALVFMFAWGIPSSFGGWLGLVVLAAGSYVSVLIIENTN